MYAPKLLKLLLKSNVVNPLALLKLMLYENIVLSRPGSGLTIKRRGFWLDIGFIRQLQFLVIFHSGALANSQLQSAVHLASTEPLGLLPSTSPLVPSSNCERSFSRLPEISPPHSHSDT
jgi:hypothetical protein